MRYLTLLSLLALGLTACPRGEAGKRAPAPCTKLGEQCEFEPGKLGACSYRTNCDGPNCLYCQSQH
jgi:hypothetical protein